MGEQTGVSTGLRWTWAAGAVVLAVGGLLALGGSFSLVFPGFLLLAVAGGVTAARGSSAGVGWLVAAWSTLLLPVVAAFGILWWLVDQRADPLAVVLLVYFAVAVWIGVLVAFAVALVVELVRLHRRRRRFGEARPAWKNDPTPPSYS